MLDVVRQISGAVCGLGVLAAAMSLLARFRRASGLERKQLLWLAPAAVLIPILVAASFAASYANNTALLGVVGGLFVVLLPLATALAITRYHLFDIDRILSRALTYLLLSAVLAVTYVLVVVAVGAAFGSSQLTAIVATLAVASVARPAYGKLQAVADPTLRVAYWVDGRREWVTADGRPATPGAADIELLRHDRRIARVGFDRVTTSPELVEAAVVEARPELDNAGLRAAVAPQLVEVRKSRARIVAAADASRRQIERNARRCPAAPGGVGRQAVWLASWPAPTRRRLIRCWASLVTMCRRR